MKRLAGKILQLIEDSSNIIIVSHENPDGDAIGSTLAFSHFLNNIGKKNEIWLPGHFPDYYRWMRGSDKIRYYTGNQKELTDDLNKFDLLIAMDISTLIRTGKMNNALERLKIKRKILIDHHIDPDEKAFDVVLSDVSVSSTCELLYHFFNVIEVKGIINELIAESLYVGIMTDTGSFSFNCNSPITYEVTASLIHKGISPVRIHKLVYDNNSESRIRLLGYALQKMKVLPEYHTAYISLDKTELEKLRSRPGDTEGIVNFALSIKGIVLAAFFSWRDKEIKISFRSKGNFSVNDFARDHFNGGGHHNAAGGTFNKGTIDDAVKFMESLLPKYKKQLSQTDELLYI